MRGVKRVGFVAFCAALKSSLTVVEAVGQAMPGRRAQVAPRSPATRERATAAEEPTRQEEARSTYQ